MEGLIEIFSSPQAWAQLVTLIFLEIVLGIDNIVFISITSNRLEKSQQHKGRRLGLAVALVGRIALLMSLSWVMSLTHPLVSFGGFDVTGKNLILLIGGVYLMYKGFVELRDMLNLVEERERHGHPDAEKRDKLSLARALVTIFAMDIVFSLDSVITAVGLSNVIPIMVIAIIIAIGFMMIFADVVADFINTNPAIKLLALIFIETIGILLVIEFFHIHVDEWYVYFAMFFSLVVTLLQMRYSKNLSKMHLYIKQHKEGTLAGKSVGAHAATSDEVSAEEAELEAYLPENDDTQKAE